MCVYVCVICNKVQRQSHSTLPPIGHRSMKSGSVVRLDLESPGVLVDLWKSCNVTQWRGAAGHTAVSNQRQHGAFFVPALLRFPGLFLTPFVPVIQPLQQMPASGKHSVFSKAVVKVWRERRLCCVLRGSLTCLCIVHEGMESFWWEFSFISCSYNHPLACFPSHRQYDAFWFLSDV